MNENIRFCQYLLAGARAEANKLGIRIPKRLTALRSTNTQFFVEGDGIKGEYVGAGNACDAKAKFILHIMRKGLDMTRPTRDEYREAARVLFRQPYKVEIEDNAPVKVDEEGAWVQVWCRVFDQDVRER